MKNNMGLAVMLLLLLSQIVGVEAAWAVPTSTCPLKPVGVMKTEPVKVKRPSSPMVVANPNPPPRALPRGTPIPLIVDRPRFSFQSSTGLVEKALSSLLTLNNTSVDNEIQAGEILGSRFRAQKTIQTYASRAASILVAELRKLNPQDLSSHIELLGLLEEVKTTPTAISYLLQMALTPELPRDRISPLETSCSSQEKNDPLEPQKIIRNQVVSLLSAAARKGNAAARNALLQALRSPSKTVKLNAIHSYYEVMPNRAEAKRTMKQYLNPQEHYLLHQI